MDEEDEDANASDREYHPHEHRDIRNERALIAAANGANDDQAVDKYAGEYAKNCLYSPAIYESPQYA